MNRDIRTVLIVEDEEDLRAIVRMMLEGEGFRVLEASSGNRAIALFKDQGESVDAILSDINMMDGSGIELLAWLRGKGYRIPIVFITAFDSREHLQETLRLGSFDFISKPFNAKDLIATTYVAVEAGIKIKQVLEQIRSSGIPKAEADEIIRKLEEVTYLQARNNRLKKTA